MNSHQAKYESALDRFALQIAQRDKEATQERARNLFWTMGTVIGAVALAVAILGYLA